MEYLMLVALLSIPAQIWGADSLLGKWNFHSYFVVNYSRLSNNPILGLEILSVSVPCV